MNTWNYDLDIDYTIHHADGSFEKWQGVIFRNKLTAIKDRKHFLNTLATKYGLRTSLTTHPTTKHGTAKFAGIYNGHPATYAVFWFPPKES